MPKSFNNEEKKLIRKELLTKGREHFSSFGFKKTSVGDLTNAVGISLGSFYKFFSSKEELYLEILQEEHHNIEKTITSINNGAETPYQVIKSLIFSISTLIESNSLLKKLYENRDYELLLRKLPPETLEKHRDDDTKLIYPLIESWQKSGHLINKNPEIISGLFRAIFFIAMHKREIGIEIFPDVMELIAEFIAAGLTNKISPRK